MPSLREMLLQSVVSNVVIIRFVIMMILLNIAV